MLEFSLDVNQAQGTFPSQSIVQHYIITVSTSTVQYTILQRQLGFSFLGLICGRFAGTVVMYRTTVATVQHRSSLAFLYYSSSLLYSS